MMNAKFSFSLGNRGLLQEEVGVVDIVNDALQASARKHGKTLKRSSTFTVKVVTPAGKPVRRAAATDQDPIELPLAAG